ncbi:COG2958 family protein [Vibrio harveyi]
MAKLSQTNKIVNLLKNSPKQKFTARQIAESIVAAYPEDYTEKRQNPRFADDKAFMAQIVAEIGAQKNLLTNKSKNIHWQDKPRPRVYWFDPEVKVGQSRDIETEEDSLVEDVSNTSFSEHDLYPILIDYLMSEHGLYCQRINEKRSRNQRGSGGNQWLHPDIVAMQTVDKEWNELVRSCVQQGAGQSVRLWSFEVKKEITNSNVRKSFFQAVSNSSWANEGYLVATSVSDNTVEQELRMLSALHGIGVILLNPENPSESEMTLPARARAEVDWQSVNRIVVENPDFKDYIELVSTYYQTGRVRNQDWNN